MPLTGLVLTKLDGTAKGGGIIGISQELGVPIYHIGIGEAVEDLRTFDATEFVDALFEAAEGLRRGRAWRRASDVVDLPGVRGPLMAYLVSMRRNPIVGLAFTLLLLGVALPSEGAAQEFADGAITVIQPKPVLRRQRVQLTPRFGTTINDPILRQWTVGGTLAYNATERFGLDVSFDWFDFGNALGGVTGRYEEVISTTSAAPEVAPLDWFGALEFSYVPLYGKGVLFNRVVVFWDLYTSLGPGLMSVNDETSVGATLAGGVNLYGARWFGINTEFAPRRERGPAERVAVSPRCHLNGGLHHLPPLTSATPTTRAGRAANDAVVHERPVASTS